MSKDRSLPVPGPGLMKRITMECERVDSNPNMDDAAHPMDHWCCHLRFQGRNMKVVFSMGSAHNGKAPKLRDVMPCLVSDSLGAGASFSEWCAEYGYDTDSRKAEATYNAVERQSRALRQLLTDSLDTVATMYEDR